MSASGLGFRKIHLNVMKRAAIAAASLLLPAVASAGVFDTAPVESPSGFVSGAPSFAEPVSIGGQADASQPADKPVYMDDAPAGAPAGPPPEQPNVHGFFSSPFKTAYVTPRGLVVENAGLVWQPVVGLVFPIGDIGPIKNFTVVGGIWNSVNTNQHDPFVGPWNEMDAFVSFSGTVAEKFSLALTYSPWFSPPHAFKTEHNMDLKVGYDDSKMWGSSGFALNPYVDLFWAISGDSTVILGRKGGTGYFEPGIVPTWTYKGIAQYPMTISVPIYTQLGDAGYWDATRTFSNQIIGLVSISGNVSVPLSFIPVRYGHWHADVGVTYDYLINNALLQAGTIASGNDNRNVIIGSAGVGVNF
jgi:hypothetical protein